MESRTKRLEHLLNVELARLKVAKDFEERKKIVFPETTQIVRDILKIEDMLEKKILNLKIAEAQAKNKNKNKNKKGVLLELPSDTKY